MSRSGRETKKMHQRHRFGTFLAAISLFSASLWSDAEGRVTRQIDKQARAPDLLFAGLLNPFPAVFMAGHDGNVVVLARGNPSDFEPARIKRNIDSPDAGLPKLSKEQADRLRSYFPEIKQGEVVVFFLTVDEQMSREGAEVAAKSLTPARTGVEKATTPLTLAVLKAAN